jgi:hypothetical protein
MFKTPSMEIMAQMKLVGMSMTFSPAGTTANNLALSSSALRFLNHTKTHGRTPVAE